LAAGGRKRKIEMIARKSVYFFHFF